MHWPSPRGNFTGSSPQSFWSYGACSNGCLSHESAVAGVRTGRSRRLVLSRRSSLPLRSALTAAAFRPGLRLGSGFGKTKAGGFVCSQGTRGANGAVARCRDGCAPIVCWCLAACQRHGFSFLLLGSELLAGPSGVRLLLPQDPGKTLVRYSC